MQVQYRDLHEQYKNLHEQYRDLHEQYSNLHEQYKNLHEQYSNLQEQYKNLQEQYKDLPKKGGESAIYAFFAEPARFFCEFGRNVCYTFADIFNQRSKTMKNIINKIILFAAVVFAAGFNISANAQSYGYYLVDNNRSSGFNTLFSATGYPSAELAEDGAVQNCVDSGGGSDNDCRTFYVGNRGVFGGTETNQVIVWSQETMLGLNFVGLGVDFAAAYADLFAKCITSRGATDCADTVYAEENVLSCGTGTAEDLTDDCGVRFTSPPNCGTGTTGDGGRIDGNCVCTDNTHMLITDTATNTQTCAPPPLNCNRGSTFGVDADGDGNCDCVEDAQIQVDAENCRTAETLQDCVNAGFTSFNPETVMCTNTAPNCTDNATLNDAGVCECDPGFPILEQEGENTFACRAPLVATDCGDDLPDFYDGSTCVSDCGEGFRNPANAGETCIEITAADCGQNNMPNFYDGSMCVADCGDDFVNPANAGETCRPIAEVLATVSVSPTYTAESCERAGWISSIAINSEKTEVAEVCGIPVERNDNLPAAAARESQPQIADGEMANGCIIRESADFLTLPDCNDSQLFGDDGFPQMPADFNIANDRLIIVVVADGRNRIFFNDNEIRIAVASPRNNDAEVAIIGAVGVAMAMYAIADFLHDGRPADAFAFSPEFGYRISENDYFVQAGGKIEYAVNENLRMQWSAGQTNTGGDFGDFRYLSKAEYTADFWTAAFSESVSGKTADYDFSLSADLQNGIWKISPVYRMQSEWKESDSGIETETQNELNLESVLRYNRWTIRPSAGFRWENFGNFTENGKLQMNAVYRF